MDIFHRPQWPFHLNRPDRNIPRPIVSLSVNRLLGDLSGSVIGLFFPIFIYEWFGHSLRAVFLWYMVSYAIRLPLLITGAKLFSRIGLAASMAIGTVFWAFFYLGAYFLATPSGINPWLFHGVIILSATVVNVLYWAPFHIDFTTFSSRQSRGAQLGALYAISFLLGLVGPALGGLIVTNFSYRAVFIVGFVTIALSVIPLFFLPKVRVDYKYGYLETFRMMWSRRYRPLTLSMLASGSEGGIAAVAWPIFLFLVFSGRYLDVGLFASVVAAVSIAIQLVMGRLMDKDKAGRMLKTGVGLYSLGWLFKAFVDSVGGAFVASTFHNFSGIILGTPLDYLTYNKAGKMRDEMDEFLVIREIALTLGRALVMLLAMVMVVFLPLRSVFVLAAVVSIGMGLITRFTALEE